MATTAFEEIAETFDFLDDWEDRYRHVIELGKAMAPMADAVKVPATKVEGCASQVWMLPRIEGQGPQARFDFEGESDALIVRGLIAILHALYAGLTAEEVLKVDAAAELAQKFRHGAVVALHKLLGHSMEGKQQRAGKAPVFQASRPNTPRRLQSRASACT